MPDQPAGRLDHEQTPGLLRRILLSRRLLAAGTAMIVYALCGFLLIPWLLKRTTGSYFAENLGRRASVTEVRFNPFLFKLDVREFVLQEADGRPILGFERLFLDFELSSLFRWAWTFAHIRLEQPSVHVEIRRDGRLNFVALADEFPTSEDPPPADGRPPRLLVKLLELVDGTFTFRDLSDATPASETLSPLDLELREISTLPERKGPYTIRAELPGGGKVGWRGEISVHPISSEGELKLTGFKLATAWKFVQDELRIAEPSGELTVTTRYRFDYREQTPLLTIEDATVSLEALSLKERDTDAPLLALEALEAVGMRFDLQSRQFLVPNMVVRNGSLAASVDEGGLLNWQRIVTDRKSTDPARQNADASPPVGKPWLIRAEAVNVSKIAVAFHDRSRAAPLKLALGELNVDLSASAELGAGPAKAIVDDLEVALHRVSLSEPAEEGPFLSLDTIALKDGRIDLDQREISIARVHSSGGETSVVRGRDGRFRLIDLLVPGDEGGGKRDLSEAAGQARAGGKPWSFSLDSFEMNGFRVSFQDQTFTPAIVYDLEDIQASLGKLVTQGETPVDFETGLRTGEGGRVHVTGLVDRTGNRIEARAEINRVNLKPMHPALTRFTLLALDSGWLSASADFEVLPAKSNDSTPRLRVNGRLSVDDFLLKEQGTEQRFLSWKNLSAKGIVFDLFPRRLRIEDVRLEQPGAKVVIFEDRSINLTEVLKRPHGTDKAGTAKPETVPASGPTRDNTLFPVNIERIRMERGVVDFSDLALLLPFTAQVTDFTGGIAGISSDPASRASIAFDGRVGKYGLTTVRGVMRPFAPKDFTDITVVFRDVEMKPLSPYSATFAGRRIASGSLNLQLEYKIQNSELLGDHEVVLERFTLGERVEAPDAIRLPLDLAVALLTDTEGRIDVAVPVRGNVDDPEFEYGQMIRQAIVNLITKIVTSPFRALGGLVGEKGEPLDAIAFHPGSDRLLPPERKKIERVVEALRKRPQLRLVVQGRFDPEADGEALRTRSVRLALAGQMGMSLAPNEDPGPTAFDNARTQKALEQLLERRDGEEAVADFEKRYAEDTGKKAKRVKPYLVPFGRGSPDTTFYRAIFEELVKLEPAPAADLEALARGRARAIVQEVQRTGGFDATRAVAGAPGPVEEASTETVDTKLTLDVVQPASSCVTEPRSREGLRLLRCVPDG